jgi:hypothetical protein
MPNYSYGKHIKRIARYSSPSSYTELTYTNHITNQIKNLYPNLTKSDIINYINENKWKFHPPPRPNNQNTYTNKKNLYNQNTQTYIQPSFYNTNHYR